ncbi:MAG: phosphoenolpyruvate--protein phosphotransferase, partial [Phycisphaeraceae bacterium]|nr:phosphoenolpyruvate--protein phosphotransferase [Phycisphaeraceae bacterium]
MQIKQGIPVSPGVAINDAVVIDAADVPVPRRTVAADKVDQELKRLDEALAASRHDLDNLQDQAATLVGPDTARIFAFHLGMLQDEQLIERYRRQIQDERVTAEYAVYTVMRELARNFRQQESRYFRDRVSDIWDLERRVIGHLVGHARQELQELDDEAILVSHDLTPSQTAVLDTTHIRGIATDAGGRTSHTAILAHALGIPAVVGLEDIAGSVDTGQTLIIDGNRGQVIVDPNAEQLMEYREYLQQQEEHVSSLDDLRNLPAETTDGTTLELMAYIVFPHEIVTALNKGAEGIGLYRTEFLFLAAEVEPTEDEQVEAYEDAIGRLDGRPLTIRTVDLGADKMMPDHVESESERNPFLGVRSIRLCLQNLPMFKTQ